MIGKQAVLKCFGFSLMLGNYSFKKSASFNFFHHNIFFQDPAIFSQLNKYSTDLEQSTSIPSKQKSSRYSEKQQQWKGNASIYH